MARPQGQVEPALVFQRWRELDHTRNFGGRVPPEWREILDNDPLMRDVVMVFDLVFGGNQSGVSVRVATATVDSISARDGAVFDPFPVLLAEPEIDQVYTVGEGTSSARAVAMTIDPRVVDPATRIAEGVLLAGFGEVSLEPRKGGDYDKRFVIMRGDMGGGVEFGAFRPNLVKNPHRDSELMQLEIVDPKETIGTKLPPWVATRDRFPDLHKRSSAGERIPIVINGYAEIPAFRISTGTAAPQEFVFAVSDGFTVDTADGVRVNGVTRAAASAAYTWQLFTDRDEFGVQYSGIRFTAGGTHTWEDTDTVNVTAEVDTAERAELGVVDALRHVLERYSPVSVEGVNPVLFAEAAARFPSAEIPRILINAAGGGGGGTVLEWAESGYLESFPMLSMVWEGGGYGPVFTDFRDPPQAVWIAGEHPIYDRDTLVQESPKGDIFNEFVLRYDYDSLLDTFQEVEVLGAVNSNLCQYSRDVIGERDAEVLESRHITTRPLALFVLDWLATHQALPSYYVEYIANPRILIEHRRGDTVAFSDEEFGWVEEPTTIERIRYSRGKVIIGLRVWVRYLDLGGSSISYAAGGRS